MHHLFHFGYNNNLFLTYSQTLSEPKVLKVSLKTNINFIDSVNSLI
jgi:hypothetical protein